MIEIINLSYSIALQKQNLYLETCNAVNMYSSVLIIIGGLIGNLLTIIILLYSKATCKNKKIGSNYLIVLAITNTVCLTLQFYMNTYNQIVSHFDLTMSSAFQLFDSNIYVCKSLPYLKHCARSLNTMITVCFSLERLIAVYWPLKTRSLKPLFVLLFKLSIFMSFLIPSYLLFFVELLSNDDSMYKKFNPTLEFNFFSHSSSSNSLVCSIHKKHIFAMEKLQLISLAFIIVSNVFISGTLLAIVIKLKKNRHILSPYFNMTRKSCSCSTPPSQPLSPAQPIESVTCEEQNETLLKQSASSSRTTSSSSQKSVKSFRKTLSITSSTVSAIAPLYYHFGRRNGLYMCNYKSQGTKTLISVSLTFAVANTPYLIVFFYSCFYLASDNEIFLEPNLLSKMKIQAYLALSDLFHLANCCVPSLLFICSGHLFRLYACKFFTNFFSCSFFK